MTILLLTREPSETLVKKMDGHGPRAFPSHLVIRRCSPEQKASPLSQIIASKNRPDDQPRRSLRFHSSRLVIRSRNAGELVSKRTNDFFAPGLQSVTGRRSKVVWHSSEPRLAYSALHIRHTPQIPVRSVVAAKHRTRHVNEVKSNDVENDLPRPYGTASFTDPLMTSPLLPLRVFRVLQKGIQISRAKHPKAPAGDEEEQYRRRLSFEQTRSGGSKSPEQELKKTYSQRMESGKQILDPKADATLIIQSAVPGIANISAEAPSLKLQAKVNSFSMPAEDISSLELLMTNLKKRRKIKARRAGVRKIKFCISGMELQAHLRHFLPGEPKLFKSLFETEKGVASASLEIAQRLCDAGLLVAVEGCKPSSGFRPDSSCFYQAFTEATNQVELQNKIKVSWSFFLLLLDSLHLLFVTRNCASKAGLGLLAWLAFWMEECDSRGSTILHSKHLLLVQ